MAYSSLIRRRTYDMISRERFDWSTPEVSDGIEKSLKAELISVSGKGIEIHPGAKQVMGLTTKSGNLRGIVMDTEYVITRIPGFPVLFLQELPAGLVHGVKRGRFLNINANSAYIRYHEGFYQRFGLIKGHYEYREDLSGIQVQGMPGKIWAFLCLLDNNKLSELKQIWHQGMYARVRDKLLYIDVITATRMFAINCRVLNYSISTEDGHIWISPSNEDPEFGYQKLHSDLRSGYLYAEVPVRAGNAGLSDGYYIIDDFSVFGQWGYHRLTPVPDDYKGIPEVLRNVL